VNLRKCAGFAGSVGFLRVNCWFPRLLIIILISKELESTLDIVERCL